MTELNVLLLFLAALVVVVLGLSYTGGSVKDKAKVKPKVKKRPTKKLKTGAKK